MTPGMRARARLKQSIRSWMEHRGYLEVDTPVLVPQPGCEVHIDYFETSYLDYAGASHPRWLRSSPELAMKVLLQDPDLERCYQLAPCFRNGGEFTEWHRPEFFMLEYYCSQLGFKEFQLQCVEMFQCLAQEFGDHQPSQRRASFQQVHHMEVAEAFQSFAGIQLRDQDPDLAKQAIASGCLSPRPDDDFETSFFKVLLERIEPEFKNLGTVVLSGYPASQAILAKVTDGVAQRFEIYVEGIELCNGFDECLAPQENRERLKQVNRERLALGKPQLQADEDFFAALKGQETKQLCGNAVGFDRLLALLLGQQQLL